MQVSTLKKQFNLKFTCQIDSCCQWTGPSIETNGKQEKQWLLLQISQVYFYTVVVVGWTWNLAFLPTLMMYVGWQYKWVALLAFQPLSVSCPMYKRRDLQSQQNEFVPKAHNFFLIKNPLVIPHFFDVCDRAEKAVKTLVEQSK